MEIDTTDEEQGAPNAPRVAARAIALGAVVSRGFLECDPDRHESEIRRLHLFQWLEDIGVANELEEWEDSLIQTPHGLLDQQSVIEATWRSEGMLVLAWSLGRATLPSYDEPCASSVVAERLGFLNERSKTVLASPLLRERAEIELWADTYLTVHWRLRQYRIDPTPIDLADYVSGCKWGPLTLAGVNLIDGDLGIRGERIDRVPEDWRDHATSIVQERHQAFNWLLGSAPVYSDVTTDT